jgi:hypothetical protein
MTAARNLAALASNIAANTQIVSTSNIYDSKGGVRDIPQNAKTSSYTLLVTDGGKHTSTNSAVIIPAAVFATGEVVTIYNNSAASISITCSAITTYKSGVDSVITSATLLPRGLATILFYSATAAVISGNI